MKRYWEFIEEMARNIGNYSYSPISDSPEYRKSTYDRSCKYAHHNFPIPTNKNIEITHYKNSDGEDNYFTNDHVSKETLHHSVIKVNGYTKQFPFTYQEQNQFDRINSNDVLPKGYAQNFIYNHFKHSNIPLKSSDTQFLHGHKMWRNLAHKTLEDGYHVYYHDGDKLHKSTKDNVDKHLNSYFGSSNRNSDVDYEKHHMILSKIKLDNL